ncbi:hypothetical protein ISP15_00415 [Dyella jejuensis]|uniref:Uncharacterized protein n=1 Tax=Dyella jejuensis TaxID=1432009 RepID=A0ABW8JCQ0_9GAMM
MDESYDAAVSAALLSYSVLSKTQRAVFMDRLNHFLFVSPQQQRRLAKDWFDSCKDSTTPLVQMIAESSAAYVTQSNGRKRK